jgi:transcriptional regulator with XRE-family HTH domain
MEKLRQLMAKAEIKSFAQLARLAAVSDRTIAKIRSGNINSVRWQTIVSLAAALNLTPLEFLQALESIELPPVSPPAADGEWEFKLATLDRLESFLTYYPTAKQAALDRPDFPATKLIPLIAPIETLMAEWGVETIGQVGENCPYHPQWHEPISGHPQPGEMIKIRYVGYRLGDRLLFRARVSPLAHK